MPKIASYTPAWLTKPALGHELFLPKQEDFSQSTALSNKVIAENIKRNSKPGARRLVAARGSEVFVAVGKEIRWGDLVSLKENWEEEQATKNNGTGTNVDLNDVVEGGDPGQGVRVSLT
jgi:nucleoporin NUP82